MTVLAVLAALIILAWWLGQGLGVNRFSRGDLQGVKFQPTDSFGNNIGAQNAINVTGWSFDLTATLVIVTHTGLGGRGVGRIASTPDTAVTISWDYDEDLPVIGFNLMNEGQNGFLQIFLSQTPKTFQLPMIVEKVHFENPSGLTKIQGSCDLKNNACLGFIVLPTFP